MLAGVLSHCDIRAVKCDSSDMKQLAWAKTGLLVISNALREVNIACKARRHCHFPHSRPAESPGRGFSAEVELKASCGTEQLYHVCRKFRNKMS